MNCTRYLLQAKSNENAARHIETDYPDWTVTMCFYSALHFIEHYASQEGVDITSKFPEKSPHDSRRSYVRQLARKLNSRELEKQYNFLEHASRKARYLEMIRQGNAIDFFKSHQPDVEASFQKLQLIKDILKIS